MVMIMKATDQRIRAEILARYDVDARRCREVFFPAGQQLHAQDAPLENIFLVISGSIFISKSSSNGYIVSGFQPSLYSSWLLSTALPLRRLSIFIGNAMIY